MSRAIFPLPETIPEQLYLKISAPGFLERDHLPLSVNPSGRYNPEDLLYQLYRPGKIAGRIFGGTDGKSLAKRTVDPSLV